MADAPRPITSPPAQPWQPYEPESPGSSGEKQTAATTIYDAAGSTGGSQPWIKVQDAGAISLDDGSVSGGWPGNGTNDASAWKQT